MIFRRGPSKRVRLTKWDLTDDSFEPGQWFKGRIYERRCDLSPSGKKLVYFAANHKPPFGSWSAVSRPPYLTALALWPKGDCWGGGGLFQTEKTLQLNHREDQLQAHDDHRPQKNLRVVPLEGAMGWGEDFPIWALQMERDGWHYQDGKREEYRGSKAKIAWHYAEPAMFRRRQPKRGAGRAELRVLIDGIHERGGAWYVLRHQVYLNDDLACDLGRSDWANWDPNGDLLFAKQGKLYRLSPGRRKTGVFDLDRARELADFSADRFEAIAPSGDALVWP